MEIDKLIELLTASPEIANATITGLFDQYKPILYLVLNEIFKMYSDLAYNDEYFKTSAHYTRNRFNALVNEGFTEDQAMEIMLAEMRQFRESAQRVTSRTSTRNKK